MKEKDIEKLAKQTIRIENEIFVLRSSLFKIMNEIDNLKKIYEIPIDEEIKPIQSEIEYKEQENVLNILIYDIPPIDKFVTSTVRQTWIATIYNAIKTLNKKPFFEKAFCWFSFYYPINSMPSDLDNRFIKAIINAIKISGVIKDDNYNNLLCYGVNAFKSNNRYYKTLITISDYSNARNIIPLEPDNSIANKIPKFEIIDNGIW